LPYKTPNKARPPEKHAKFGLVISHQLSKIKQQKAILLHSLNKEKIKA